MTFAFVRVVRGLQSQQTPTTIVKLASRNRHNGTGIIEIGRYLFMYLKNSLLFATAMNPDVYHVYCRIFIIMILNPRQRYLDL